MTPLSLQLEERLRALLLTFLLENQKLNLSALRSEEACWIGNILDSVACVDIADDIGLRSGARVLDLGSGGGFPLLPLAIALPTCTFVGLDSVAKKMKAVERIAEAAGISNISVLIGRAEEHGNAAAHRERYDVVLARAVADLPLLLEYSSPFVRVGGRMVLWKSMAVQEEMARGERAAAQLGCVFERTHRYTLPGDFGERQLLVYQKTSALARTYPRSVGAAKKHPLA